MSRVIQPCQQGWDVHWLIHVKHTDAQLHTVPLKVPAYATGEGPRFAEGMVPIMGRQDVCLRDVAIVAALSIGLGGKIYTFPNTFYAC